MFTFLQIFVNLKQTHSMHLSISGFAQCFAVRGHGSPSSFTLVFPLAIPSIQAKYEYVAQCDEDMVISMLSLRGISI